VRASTHDPCGRRPQPGRRRRDKRMALLTVYRFDYPNPTGTTRSNPPLATLQ
jgi:hypothetical protein